MKKIIFFICLLFLSCNINLFAQGNEIDAYTLSNTELGGTARSISMAGAFGALGGDISVISNNPAGLGIYRSSEISGSLDLNMNKTSTNWNGLKTDQSKTKFAPNNFGFELYFPTSSGTVRNWNLGFSYNRVKNFNRRYRMENAGQSYSIADYIAARATNAFADDKGNFGISEDDLIYREGSYDPYNNYNLSSHWLPILGYESGMYGNMADYGVDDVYQSAFGRRSGGSWQTYSPKQSLLSVVESGSMDEYNIGFGMNISNFMFLGASVSVTDINYKYRSGYDELFDNPEYAREDNLYLQNWLSTEGTALSVNLGAIMNFQMLRLGVAYNSPRWYDMTDYYDATAGTYISGYNEPKMENSTPEGAYMEYKFRTPGKWIFSGAAILGQSALVSVDYELMNFKGMSFSEKSSYDDQYFPANDHIDEDFTWQHTLKLGAEIKVNPQFAVRAGYMMQTSPMKEQLYNNDIEVYPAGTIPNFTVTSNPTHYITAGIGYRFTPNFYIDLACVYKYNKSEAYAFSNTYYDDEKYGIIPIPTRPAELITKSTRIVMTLGYKF